MSSKMPIRLPRTLVLRLTLWFLGLLAVSASIAFISLYLTFGRELRSLTDRELTEDLQEFREVYAAQGLDALMEDLRAEVQSEGAQDIFFRILDDSGNQVAATNLAAWSPVLSHTEIPPVSPGGPPIITPIHLPEQHFRARVLYCGLAPGVVLQEGISTQGDYLLRRTLVLKFLLALLATLLIGSALGVIVVRNAVSGVRAVTEATRVIAHGDLGKRVPLTGHDDEVDELAATFNHMVDQLEALVRGLREVTDDLAHDLRTPIARMRGQAERLALAETATPDGREVGASIVEECDRLLNLTNTVLEISEMNAGITAPQKSEVDLVALVRDVCELFQPLAEEGRVTLAVQAPAPVTVAGVRRDLWRALANLVDNAIKYTPENGQVTIGVLAAAEKVEVTVTDSGVGIHEADLPMIFDRFYRSDHSRSQTGNGLGLSLAQAIARAHGGELRVTSTPGRGSTFTLSLPTDKT